MPSEYADPLSGEPGQLDQQIAALVTDFQQTPGTFFCEEELQAEFYSRCRGEFPAYPTFDQQQVATFRYKYRTSLRYRSGDRFAEGHASKGSFTAFDFVLLRRESVSCAPYITIANNEARRLYPSGTLLVPSEAQWAVQAAIELKLVAFQEDRTTSEAAVNRLEDRMLTACCKFAQERVGSGFIVGLSFGPLPDLARAQGIVSSCLQLYQSRRPESSLSVLVATPSQTVVGGDWHERAAFANVVASGGWPTAEGSRK
jgi:hypothetical protein